MEAGTSTSPIKRRLTAILAADAVGYSRQMSEDEERTLQVLAAQRAIIDRIILAHGGRIVSTAGDSVLAEFASSVEAVRCAVEIQEGLETRNAGLPEAERLLFRIGVNLGDVMVDGADILGDGVNVAARLEGIAEPGGVCISSSVYDQIAGKLSLGFVDIGEKSLKNIARPIRVYRFDRSGENATRRRVASQARTRWVGIGTVAVLAIAGIGVWQSGLLERRGVVPPPPPAPSPALAQAPVPAPVAAVQPPAAASEETKLKLRIAEAERARAEAELARSRTDADAAKQRTASARAERRDATAPSPPAPGPAPAAVALPPTGAAPPPAASVPAPLPVASPSLAAAAPAASPKAPQPSAPEAAPTRVAAGSGTASRFCDAWEELKPFSDTLPARVVDGEIVIERGESGQPGSAKMSGKPAPDGRLSLLGTFFPTLARLKNRELLMRFDGAYANGQYTLSGRMGNRTCTLIVRLDVRP